MRDPAARWLYEVPGRKKAYIAALMLVQMLHGASGVLYAAILKKVVDSAAARDSASFRINMITVILVSAGQLALRAAVRRLSELSRSTLENTFKQRLAETILQGDYLKVSSVHSAEWMNRLTSDTAVIADGITDIFPGLAGMLVRLVSAVIMLTVLEPAFAGLIIPGGALLVVLTWLFRKVLRKLHRAVQEADGRLRITLQESIAGLLMIRSFAAEDKAIADAQARMTDHQRARMRRNRFSNLCNVGFGAAMSGMYLLGVGWCGYGILKGTVSFGTLTAVLQLISQIQMPIANISGYLPRYYSMLSSAERLMEAESLGGPPAEAMSLQDAVDLYRSGMTGFGLDRVSFSYLPASDTVEVQDKGNMPEVLNDLSLYIKKGEYVAFTGHSGCGKSTALKLLMCVYGPDAGRVYCTGANGQEMTMDQTFRRLFAYVPQGNLLLSGSIRDVVSFADPSSSYDDNRLREALRIACADEFTDGLEGGVDALLGERGSGLSEGQMQRLAIARAVFSRSPILLLDEATGALDEATERQVLENLRNMTDRTVIIVTHRRAALSICDREIEFIGSGVIEHAGK